MALDVVGAVRAGIDRAASRDAVPIALAFGVVQVVSTVAVQSQGAVMADREETPLVDGGVFPEGGPLALDVPLSLISAVSLTSVVLLSLVTVVAMRAFVSGGGTEGGVAQADDEVETESVAQDEDVTVASPSSGRLAAPTMWGAIALLTFPLLFALGLVALAVPGVLFAITMAFVPVHLAVDDDHLLGAMVSSWRLTRGHWLRIFLLLLALLVVVVAIGVLGALPAAAVASASPAAGSVVQALFGGVSLTVVMAVLANAFVQLRAGDDPAEDDELADIDDELLP